MSERTVERLSRRGSIDARRTMDPVRRKVRPRGVPTALADHEILVGGDLREAGEVLGRALSPTVLSPVADPTPAGPTPAVQLHGVRLRDIAVLHLVVTAPVTMDMPQLGPYFGVHMPTSGRAVGTYRGLGFTALSTRSLVTSPGGSMSMRLEPDSPQLVVRIEEAALTAHLTRMLGRSLPAAVAFEPEFDMTSDPAMRWHAAVQLLLTELSYPESLAQQGHGIGALEELLMSSLLLVQPSTHHADLVRPLPRTGRRVVRDAMDYLEAHLSERVTMTDLAANVYTTVRTIQQGFRDELGTTPIAYLRDRRLERVREDLLDAMPADGVTVTRVAARWGFTHLGSFAADYKRRWGESPSQTLRR